MRKGDGMPDALSEHYADLLEGSYDCVDRLVLNAYFRLGHSGGGFRTWWQKLYGRKSIWTTRTSCAWLAASAVVCELSPKPETFRWSTANEARGNTRSPKSICPAIPGSRGCS